MNFDTLTPLSYGLILADPPWSFDNWSAKGERKNPKVHYACQGIDWIKSLPVGQLAAPECILILWATNPMLPQAIETMAAWGFTYKTAGTWVKLTKHEKIAFGTGYVLRSANEPFLIGTIGKPKTSRSVRSVVASVREHSRKPDEMRIMAEALFPGVRRCELFARESVPGWDCWGNETTKFEAIA